MWRIQSLKSLACLSPRSRVGWGQTALSDCHCTLSAKCWMMKDVFDILGFSNKEFLLIKLLYSFWSQFSSVPCGNWKRKASQLVSKNTRDEKLTEVQKSANSKTPRWVSTSEWPTPDPRFLFQMQLQAERNLSLILTFFRVIFKGTHQCPFRRTKCYRQKGNGPIMT